MRPSKANRLRLVADVDDKRRALMDQIMAFRSDEARYRAYTEVREIERLAQNANPPIIMCACPNWERCEHPWPQRVRL